MPSLLVLAAAAFEIVTLTQGIHVAIVQPEPPMYVFANALIIEDDEAVTVVDTHQSPSAAAALIEEIAKLTPKRVGFVINTHWHGDHVYGNQVYRERFPDVVIIGHESVGEDMETRGQAYLDEELQALPDSIRQRAEWLRSGNGPDGTPLTDDLRARVETSHRMRSEYLEELKGLVLTPPDRTFTDELVLRRPGRTIQLIAMGPAHTRGDVVVFLPDDGIAAVGDLLEDGAFPYFGHATPSGWAEALNRIGELDAPVLVPSHGAVQRDRKLLQFHFRLIRSLQHEVEVSVLRGLSLEQTQERVTLEGFTADLPGSEDNVRTAVEKVYLEEKGELEP